MNEDDSGDLADPGSIPGESTSRSDIKDPKDFIKSDGTVDFEKLAIATGFTIEELQDAAAAIQAAPPEDREILLEAVTLELSARMR